MNTEKFKGVFPAFYACYDDNGEISAERTQLLAKHLMEKGVKGLYVGGSSGECIYQSVEDRKKILENVKKETGKVAAITGIGLILMWIVFGVLHAFMPQKVPFDYTVFLGGAVGGCVAVLNFFFMGLAVQKAAAATDEDTARMRIKASYSQRMLIQMLWVILAIVAPCFHFVAGIVPLLFPGTGIKIAGIFHTNK